MCIRDRGSIEAFLWEKIYMNKSNKLVIVAMLIAMMAVAIPQAMASPNLTLVLNNTMDGTSTPLVGNSTNITSAALFNTTGAMVENSSVISADGMSAMFDLSNLTVGDYFINVNNITGALVPTRIVSIASDINQ